MATPTSSDFNIINGLFALTGALIGFVSSLIKDLITNRQKITLEKVKIHERNRLEAYKRLFGFAREITSTCFPLAQDKRDTFIGTMERVYKNKIELDYPYFTLQIIEILDRFNDRYICMTDPDLIPEMDREDEEKFLEKQLYDDAQKIEKLFKRTMRV